MFIDYLNLLILVVGIVGIIVYMRRIYLDLIDQCAIQIQHMVKCQDIIRLGNTLDRQMITTLEVMRDVIVNSNKVVTGLQSVIVEAIKAEGDINGTSDKLLHERLTDLQYIIEKMHQDFTEFTAVEAELPDLLEKPPETVVNPYWDEKRGVYSAAKYKENMEKKKNSGIVLETSSN